MTAREKFMARLKELGLEADYAKDGHVGKVMDDGRIVVLVHIEDDPKDGYSEFRYKPYEELWHDPIFRKRIKNEFYISSGDDHFVAELAYWLDIHRNCKCPLFPVDLYWAGIDCEYFEYEDDSPINLYGREWQEYIGPFEPDEDRDWLVARLPDGDMWMNNESGHIVLDKHDSNFLVSQI